MIIFLSVLLGIRNLLEKQCTENQRHILCSVIFSKDISVCEIMWKNMVQPDSPQMTMQYGACALHSG
jgi:hypothetical protein